MKKVQYTKELLSDLIARFYRHREEGVYDYFDHENTLVKRGG